MTGSARNRKPTATKTGKPRPTTFKKGVSGNPNGRPKKRRSLRQVFLDAGTDDRKEKIAIGFYREAANGSIPHLEYIKREIGEVFDVPHPELDEPTPDVGIPGGIYNLNLGDDAVRVLAQQFFVAAAMGTADASGTGDVRQPGTVEALPAPDAGQRRPGTRR